MFFFLFLIHTLAPVQMKSILNVRNEWNPFIYAQHELTLIELVDKVTKTFSCGRRFGDIGTIGTSFNTYFFLIHQCFHELSIREKKIWWFSNKKLWAPQFSKNIYFLLIDLYSKCVWFLLLLLLQLKQRGAQNEG